jgi:hypothetical protein
MTLFDTGIFAPLGWWPAAGVWRQLLFPAFLIVAKHRVFAADTVLAPARSPWRTTARHRSFRMSWTHRRRTAAGP